MPLMAVRPSIRLLKLKNFSLQPRANLYFLSSQTKSLFEVTARDTTVTRNICVNLLFFNERIYNMVRFCLTNPDNYLSDKY